MSTEHSAPEGAEADLATWEFEVWQEGLPVACAGGDDLAAVLREIRHYAAVYSQDGPVEIRPASDAARKLVDGPPVVAIT